MIIRNKKTDKEFEVQAGTKFPEAAYEVVEKTGAKTETSKTTEPSQKELLAQAAELGIEGLAKNAKKSDIQAAIDAKKAESNDDAK